MIVICDTSFISNLLQVGLIEALHTLYGEVVITPAVRRELYQMPEHEKQVEQTDWIVVKSPTNQMMILQLLEELDLGEAESIALAVEENANYLIIDEYKGRKIADAYGVRIVGVLGVLIQAKKQGVISAVGPYINKLVEIGFRLDKKLIETVLKALGEL